MPYKKIARSINHITSFGGKAPPYLTRFIRYGSVGLVSITLNLIILFFFTRIILIHYAVSAALAFIIVDVINYTININWGFKDAPQKNIKGYSYFVTIDFLTLVSIIAILSFLVEILSLNYLIARIIAGASVGIFNFMANTKLSFQMPLLR